MDVVDNELEQQLRLISATAIEDRLQDRGSKIRWNEAPLKPVDLDSAVAIFQAILNKTDEHAINLIRAVDCIPLAVTLIAYLAAVHGETTEALWVR